MIRSVFTWVTRQFVAREAISGAKGDAVAHWDAIRKLFSLDREVRVGRVGGSARVPPQYVVLGLIADQRYEEFLLRNCTDDDPIVAAYCCRALFLSRSSLLAEAVRSVSERREPVAVTRGIIVSGWRASRLTRRMVR